MPVVTRTAIPGRGVLAATLLVTVATGCSGWYAVSTTIPLPADTLAVTRVVRGVGPSVKLSNVIVTSDSIVGISVGRSSSASSAGLRVSVARADVARLETQSFDPVKTLGFLILAVLGLAILSLVTSGIDMY